jgi:hypothetical protein
VVTGRYTQGGVSEDKNSKIGWWERRIYPKADDDVEFTIPSKYNKRPDMLAFDLYGRATLMWVILQYNHIVDINEEFIEGKEILLPSEVRLQTEILAKP